MAATPQPNLPPTPPPGFTLDAVPASSASPPAPPPGFTLDAPAGNTGGVSGSWEPETLGQKVKQIATAPSRMFAGMAASDEAARQQALSSEYAKPNASPLHAALKSAEYGIPAAAARVMEGVTTPLSVAEGVGAAVFPEIIGPVIAAQGAKTMLTPKQPGEQAPDYLERFLGGGAALAGGAAAGAAGAPRAADVVDKVSDLQDKAAAKIARPTLQRTAAMRAADEKWGHNPEEAIVKNRITTSKQAAAKLDETGKQIEATLNKPEHLSKTVNVKPVITGAAQAAIADAQRAGNPGAVKRIVDVRNAMLSKYGNLAKNPLAAAKMKTQIYGDVKWSGADHESEVNGFRKDVAAGIRNAVNDAVPEVKELNRQYGNIASAHEELKRGEDARADKGLVKSTRQGAELQLMRKVAQAVGKRYPEPGPGMTKPGTAIVPRGEQGIDQFFKGKKQLPQ